MTRSPENYEAILEQLRKDVLENQHKRAEHIFATEEECAALGWMVGFDEDEMFDLRVSALLHDITHSLRLFNEHLEICQKGGIIPDEEYIKSHPTIHSLSGSIYAREKYPDIVTDKIALAIASHTVGRKDMPLNEKILCLADYTERTRRHQPCQELRRFLWNSITPENAEDIIDEALLRYFINNENWLKQAGARLNKHMLESREDLELKMKMKKQL